VCSLARKVRALQSGKVLFSFKKENAMNQQSSARPSPAFVGASWCAMIVGILA
jgi:hypothetical protein